MITDINIHGNDISLGMNNLLDLIHSIDIMQQFIVQALMPGNVIIGNVEDHCTKTLSELLSSMPGNDSESSITEADTPKTESADEDASDEPIHVDGELSVDTDIFFKIDPELSESEAFKKWDNLSIQASGLLAAYGDYCPSAYEAADITFMSVDQLKYIIYYKELLEIWLRMQAFILSKYNTANGFKYDVMARNCLLKATNRFAIISKIVDTELDESLQINKVYFSDLEHWINGEFPRIIGVTYADDACHIKKGYIYKNTLLEASQLACKMKSLVYKLDQMHFSRMQGCIKMLEEVDKECLEIYSEISAQSF